MVVPLIGSQAAPAATVRAQVPPESAEPVQVRPIAQGMSPGRQLAPAAAPSGWQVPIDWLPVARTQEKPVAQRVRRRSQAMPIATTAPQVPPIPSVRLQVFMPSH